MISTFFEFLFTLILSLFEWVSERLEPYALEIFVLGVLVFIALLVFGGQ